MSLHSKHISCRLFLFLLLAGSFHSAANAQIGRKPLTNEDVVRMTKKGLAESVIIGAIESQDNQFDLSADGLIKLHENGVSSKVIEAMQKAQRGNRQPDVSSGGRSRTAATPTPSPTPTPLPTPTPKPTPLQVHEAEFFTFALDKCDKSGTSAVCFLTVTNNGQDRKLEIVHHRSELIDDVGGVARGKRTEAIRRGSLFHNSPTVLAGASVKVSVGFDGVSQDAKRVGRLSISVHTYGASFEVQFRDVPLGGTKPATGQPHTPSKRGDRRLISN